MQATKFENRVRFNWGYHDAHNAVKRKLDNESSNYGFGPAITIKVPLDILRLHHDKMYARGWLNGLIDSQDGKYTGDSTAAWDLALAAGHVEHGES